MATRFKHKNRAKSPHRFPIRSRWRYLKTIPILTILVALSIGLMFLYQSTFVVSDNPHAENVTPSILDRIENETSDRENTDPNSQVGRSLSEEDRYAIAQFLGQAPTVSAVKLAQTPKFILHDTSGELSDAGVQGKIQQARGPMGNGIAAYVSRNGKVAIARSIFFNQRRPTATVYEKGADILPESVRNREARRVWQATATSLRQIALKDAVAGLNLDESMLMKRATIWLNSPSEQAFEALKLDGGKTTGLWTVAQICDRVVADEKNIARMASSPKAEKTLKSVCQKVYPVLSENRNRVATSVHVELIQKRGSECYTTDAQVRSYNQNVSDSAKIQTNSIIPLQTWEREAYTSEQYEQLTRLYLQSAAQAGQYPEITTHYWLDQGKFGKIGTHCDPRGIDLMRLYQEISFAMGHPSQTLYGIKPQYGLHPEKGDNVWWSEAILSEPPPTAYVF
jgi:hypothetical protein